MNTIQDCWQEFEKALDLKLDATSMVNIKETFYYGIAAYMSMQSRAAKAVATPEGAVALVESWHDEMLLFLKRTAEKMDSASHPSH